VDSFHRLVNPGRYIPWSVARLTGITDALVADKPPLKAVLPELLGFLEGCVFVAHCAPFDHHFLGYYARQLLGRRLEMPVLCTYRLAQHLLPQLGRRNLSDLARHVGVPVEGRHRAMPDARTAANIFVRFLGILGALGFETLEDVLDLQGVARAEEPLSLAEGMALDVASLNNLPEEGGVFLLRDADEAVLYVGRSANLCRAVRGLFYPRSPGVARFARRLASVRRVEVEPMRSELAAALREARLIREYRPPLNRGRSARSGWLFLKVSCGRGHPRIRATDRLAADGAFYFGPFRKAAALRELLAAIHEVFPLKDAERAEGNSPRGAGLRPRAVWLADQLVALLEGRCGGKEQEEKTLRELARLWGTERKLAQLRPRWGRLRHLLQSHNLSGPSVRRRNFLAVERARDGEERVGYVVREGVLRGEWRFSRRRPPLARFRKAIQKLYFDGGPPAPATPPTREELEEAALLAEWLRREAYEGFVLELGPAAEPEEVIGKLREALSDPASAGSLFYVG
ncbi:MAG: exonuclease domain-containing protein, partial [Nitrospinota bacterium]